MSENIKDGIVRSKFVATLNKDSVLVGYNSVNIKGVVQCRIVEYPKLKRVILHFERDGHYWPGSFEDWEPSFFFKSDIDGWPK